MVKQAKTFVVQKVKMITEHYQMFKRFCLVERTLTVRPKTVDFKVILQTIKANLASSTQRVSGKLGI